MDLSRWQFTKGLNLAAIQRLQMGASVAAVVRASRPMFGRRVLVPISSFSSRPTA